MWLPITNIEHATTQTMPVVKHQYRTDQMLTSDKVKFNSPLKAKYVHKSSTSRLPSSFDCFAEIKYDYQTDTFSANFGYSIKSFLKSSIGASISIQINNDSDLVTKKFFPLTDYRKQTLFEIFNSSSFKKIINIKDLKTISIDFEVFVKEEEFCKSKGTFVFVKNDKYEHVKRDYQISTNNPYGEEFLYVVRDRINIGNIFEPTYKKIRFYVNEIKQDKNNVDFMNIFINEIPFERPKFSVSKMYNMPFSKNEKKDLDVFFNDNKVVRYLNNTYYDIKEKKVIEGFNENSKPGYVIPYDFSGKIYPYILVDINGISNIKISWEWNIEQQYFDDGKGKVKIYLDTNNDDNNGVSKWFKIPIDFFEKEDNKDIKLNEIFEKLEK